MGLNEEILNRYVNFVIECSAYETTHDYIESFEVKANGHDFRVLFCYEADIDVLAVVVRRDDGKTEATMFAGYRNHASVVHWTFYIIYHM